MYILNRVPFSLLVTDINEIDETELIFVVSFLLLERTSFSPRRNYYPLLPKKQNMKLLLSVWNNFMGIPHHYRLFQCF
jgi:hypothetical protein